MSNISSRFNKLYAETRKSVFRNLMLRYGHSLEDAEDIFQDAMLVLCGNIRNGKLSGGETYLHYYVLKVSALLGKRHRDMKIREQKVIKKWNKAKHEEKFSPIGELPPPPDVEKAMAKLDENSRTLLKLFYYKNYCMEAIAREMNYKNTNVVKSQKYRCLKKLSRHLSHHNLQTHDR